MQTTSNLQKISTYNTLVSELFKVVDSSEWNALTDIFHANIVYERPGYVPCVGIDKLLQFYQKERGIAYGKHYIDQIVIQENYGACWGQFIGVSKNGCQIDELFADTYSFECGKILTRRTHFFRPAI